MTDTDTRGLGVWRSLPGCVVGGLDPCDFLRIGYDTEKLIRVSAAPCFPPRVVKAIPIPANPWRHASCCSQIQPWCLHDFWNKLNFQPTGQIFLMFYQTDHIMVIDRLHKATITSVSRELSLSHRHRIQHPIQSDEPNNATRNWW